MTLKGLDVTEAMHCRQVLLQVALLFKDFRADVTLESLDVTNTVNSSHVLVHAA